MASGRPLPLPSLTGIRGVAAIWVVFFHLLIRGSNDDIFFVRDGWRAVDLFFILSGFIMMHVHARDFLKIRVRETYRFLALRVIRVYPLNIAMLLLILPAVLAAPAFVDWYRHSSVYFAHAYSFAGFWQTFFLANRWMRDLGEWNSPTWSLSLEFLAYLTFPVLAWLLGKERSRLRCLLYAAASLVALIGFQLATHQADVNTTSRVAFVRTICCFTAGVAVYRFCAIGGSIAGGKRWPAMVAAVSSIGLVLILVGHRTAVLAPIGFTSLILSLYYQQGAVHRFLASRPVLFLGEISFPIYLFHDVPLDFLRWGQETGRIPQTIGFSVMMVLVFLVVCIGASMLLHRWVEKPAQRAGRKLLERHCAGGRQPD